MLLSACVQAYGSPALLHMMLSLALSASPSFRPYLPTHAIDCQQVWRKPLGTWLFLQRASKRRQARKAGTRYDLEMEAWSQVRFFVAHRRW